MKTMWTYNNSHNKQLRDQEKLAHFLGWIFSITDYRNSTVSPPLHNLHAVVWQSHKVNQYSCNIVQSLHTSARKFLNKKGEGGQMSWKTRDARNRDRWVERETFGGEGDRKWVLIWVLCAEPISFLSTPFCFLFFFFADSSINLISFCALL